MPRYGRDYGRWGGSARPEWESGYMSGGGYDAEFGGYTGSGYDRSLRGGSAGPGYMNTGGYGYGSYTGGFGMGYGDRDASYGGSWGYESEDARGGMQSGYGERSGGDHRPRQGGSRVRAADIMTENPEAVTPDATLSDVARRMREMDVGIIPVVEDMGNRRLRGVITDRDIAVRAVAEGRDGSTTVSECMTSDVETVNKNDSVHRVMELMQREQVRRVPVTDREGRLVGIIAQADLTLEYTDERPHRERQVEDTIQRISEPEGSWRGSRDR